jgi:hypothetical protein
VNTADPDASQRNLGCGGQLGYPSLMALDRITVDPNRMRGLPCIRETRVTVSGSLGS